MPAARRAAWKQASKAVIDAIGKHYLLILQRGMVPGATLERKFHLRYGGRSAATRFWSGDRVAASRGFTRAQLKAYRSFYL